MALPTPPGPHTGLKRSHSSSEASSQPQKRRRVHHQLHHVQTKPAHIELAPQDPFFAQGQLLKSITAGLTLAGFDGVKESALEMFRAQVEEYMLKFLAHARTSMQDGRRTAPTPLDFASALAQMPTSHTASCLKPHLDLQLPEDIACPPISEPDPPPPLAPDFSNLLEPLIDRAIPSYIPKHFPARPPNHAWRHTDVFPQREKDPKKMREQATQEGMLAEQALRKLAAAAKTSAMNAEKRRNSVLSGEGKARDPARPHKRGARAHEDTFADVLKEIGGLDEATDMDVDGKSHANGGGMDLGMPEGIAVNHDMNHWRKGTSRRVA
ncbi:Hypothetical predicted protein [Lecanosticta acicola]|uniref:Transcription initiation factor TFIID subunit 8 n=1 Tax=Lecanosticta acicola TaxID=111012 RepID=A0AAI8W0R1_9PEZI|nr:Hypothetical predicted protein [Lecanosticta acicola]